MAADGAAELLLMPCNVLLALSLLWKQVLVSRKCAQTHCEIQLVCWYGLYSVWHKRCDFHRGIGGLFVLTIPYFLRITNLVAFCGMPFSVSLPPQVSLNFCWTIVFYQLKATKPAKNILKKTNYMHVYQCSTGPNSKTGFDKIWKCMQFLKTWKYQSNVICTKLWYPSLTASLFFLPYGNLQPEVPCLREQPPDCLCIWRTCVFCLVQLHPRYKLSAYVNNFA